MNCLSLMLLLIFAQGHILMAQDDDGTKADVEQIDISEEPADEPSSKKPGTLNETFLSIAAAFMGWSLKGCLTPPQWSKAPLYTLVTGSSVFLFKEITAKDEFEGLSDDLMADYKEGSKVSEKQIVALELAASQAELAAEAAEDKAANARLLKRTLMLSGTFYGAFALAHCSRKGSIVGAAGIGACLAKYNSCDDTDLKKTQRHGSQADAAVVDGGVPEAGIQIECPEGVDCSAPPPPPGVPCPHGNCGPWRPEALGDPSEIEGHTAPRIQTSSPLDPNDVSSIPGHRIEPAEGASPQAPEVPPVEDRGSPEPDPTQKDGGSSYFDRTEIFDYLLPSEAFASGTALKKIGITAGGVAVLGKTMSLQKKIQNTPDVAKGAILGGLSALAGASERKWTNAAEEYRSRGASYTALAKQLREQLQGKECPEGDPACKKDCKPEDKDCKKDDDKNGDKTAGTTTAGTATNAKSSSGIGTSVSRGGISRSQSGQPCSIGAQGSQSVDRSCSCRRTNSCTKSNFPQSNSFSTVGLPSFATQSYDELEKSADELYNGEDFGFGETAPFASIDKNAGRISKLNTAVFDKLKTQMDKNEGAGSFDKFSDNAKKGFKKAVLTSYGNLPLGMQAALLTSLGGSEFMGIDDFNFDDDFGDGIFQSEGVRLETGGAMFGSEGVSAFDAGLEAFSDEDFAQGEDERSPDSIADPIETLSDYESSENDITAKPYISIWKIISSRYMKSAVPVFLEKK